MNEKIEHSASKMMIKITEEEKKEIINELEELTKDFEMLENGIPNLEDIIPMTHTIEIEGITLREDIPVESPSIEELLKNATHTNEREIEVPKVVGE